MKPLAQILFGLLLTLGGLVAGRALAPHGAADEQGHEAHADEADGQDHEGHDHEGHDHGHDEDAKVLPAQTLATLGVEVGAVRTAEFVKTRRIQAVVVDRPLNHRPVVAPLGGIVTAIHVETGEVVAGGAPLLTIARDPIPRPKPDLTAGVLTPISETIHESTRHLRTALSQRAVTQAELERIRPFVENLSVPRKTEIDLRYELARQEQDVESARAELRAHGLTEEEIAAVGRGEPPPGNLGLWQRALERNGLWGEAAEAIRDALPPAQRDLPWCVAAIGELSAAGLATPVLARTLAELPEVSAHFAEAASLLLDGTPLDTVVLLAGGGALEPSMTIRAPDLEGHDWDVEAIHARVGRRVSAGEDLVALYDARWMWLRIAPVGGEVALVARALEDAAPLCALPLLAGTGPELTDVRLLRLGLGSDHDDGGGGAYALAANVPLPCAPGLACRSWQLRAGLRYLVEVVESRLEGRFVLPASALTYDGPTPIVFRKDGEHFDPTPVHVEYQDERVVVIADDGSLFDDEEVVLKGAFALGLALQQGTQPVDPHAGHNH